MKIIFPVLVIMWSLARVNQFKAAGPNNVLYRTAHQHPQHFPELCSHHLIFQDHHNQCWKSQCFVSVLLFPLKRKTQHLLTSIHPWDCFNVYILTISMVSCGCSTHWAGHVHNILSYIQYCTDQDSRVRLLKAPLEVRHSGGGVFLSASVSCGQWNSNIRHRVSSYPHYMQTPPENKSKITVNWEWQEHNKHRDRTNINFQYFSLTFSWSSFSAFRWYVWTCANKTCVSSLFISCLFFKSAVSELFTWGVEIKTEPWAKSNHLLYCIAEMVLESQVVYVYVMGWL